MQARIPRRRQASESWSALTGDRGGMNQVAGGRNGVGQWGRPAAVHLTMLMQLHDREDVDRTGRK